MQKTAMTVAGENALRKELEHLILLKQSLPQGNTVI
jgi:hypothetical protein